MKAAHKKLADKHGVSVSQIEKELKIGQKEEMEHTSDPIEAHKIAMDHVKEDSHYYSKLKEAGLVDELEKSILPEQKKSKFMMLKNRLKKAKYIKRFRGRDGKWKYVYKKDSSGAQKKETEEERDAREDKEYFEKRKLRLEEIKKEQDKEKERRREDDQKKREKEIEVEEKIKTKKEIDELQGEVNKLLTDLKKYEKLRDNKPSKWTEDAVKQNKEDIRFAKIEIYGKESMIARRKGISYKKKDRPQMFTMYPGEDYRVKELMGKSITEKTVKDLSMKKSRIVVRSSVKK